MVNNTEILLSVLYALRDDFFMAKNEYNALPPSRQIIGNRLNKARNKLIKAICNNIIEFMQKNIVKNIRNTKRFTNGPISAILQSLR